MRKRSVESSATLVSFGTGSDKEVEKYPTQGRIFRHRLKNLFVEMRYLTDRILTGSSWRVE
ncbi:hypothetical protein LEP1GSC055_0749 [Leptospira borgpetersenii str. Brem 307]|nr:hypothetical protein LEP1GSC055_0749 [Leptospira borgpetersenii str. Brem 307]